MEPRELIVLSDLHLGRGKNPRTGRLHRLEAFFHDDEFRGFCDYLCRDAAARGAALRMILAGDVFDLLRVDDDRDDDAGRRFAPVDRPEAAAELVEAILAGHPGVVWGLSRLVAAGHEVVLLPGNHDIELQWRAPQERVRRAVAGAMVAGGAKPEAARAAVDARVRVEPWFHHEPGRVWIEHGSQYDPEGAFRYPLRGAESALPAAALERDLPLGNFFQRYLFNGFGATAFIVPSSDASRRYVRWMLLHRPRRIARVMLRHVPFVWRFLVRLGRAAGDGSGELRARHEAQLAELAASSGLGERLRAIDALKDVRTEVVGAARAAAAQAGRALGSVLLLLLLGAGVWYLGVEGPQALEWGFWARLGSYLGMSLLVMLAVLIGVLYLLLRPATPRQQGSLAAAAQRIAGTLDVPLVVFGHTHGEDVARLTRPSGGGWYYNTGTWISVFTRDVLLPRQAVQLTYLRVRGADAELLHFDPARGGPRAVVLLDEEGA